MFGMFVSSDEFTDVENSKMSVKLFKIKLMIKIYLEDNDDDSCLIHT